MTDKYPNADTSPERLAKIENLYLSIGGRSQIHDLLAMLHEQRWRKLSEEAPPLGENVQVAWIINDCITSYIAYQMNNGNWNAGGSSIAHPDYWRPIPPLPK